MFHIISEKKSYFQYFIWFALPMCFFLQIVFWKIFCASYLMATIPYNYIYKYGEQMM